MESTDRKERKLYRITSLPTKLYLCTGKVPCFTIYQRVNLEEFNIC